MIHLEFTPEEIEALHYERFHHPHPRVQQRMEVLYLKSQGLPHKDICRLTRITENTLRSFLRQYQAGGLEGLKETRWMGTSSELDEHRETLEEFFRKNPPHSTAQAAAEIERITGIRRGLTQVRQFLKNLGMSFRKVGMIPGKADAMEQQKFLDEVLNPRLQEAKRLRRVVCFVDAAHFVHGAFLGYLWCFARMLVRTPSGRQRFNVLGAIDAVTHELTTVVNTTKIDSLSVCELLRKLSDHYGSLPLTLVLDNVSYQRCQAVQNLCRELKIELLYLPTYSPNLNLIERFWKFVKKEVLLNRYYENFTSFKVALQKCLNEVAGKSKAAIASLLTLKFQTFKDPLVLAA